MKKNLQVTPSSEIKIENNLKLYHLSLNIDIGPSLSFG